ncbi:saccharopine dehydrogenase NADP-binding domain-containing protein [Natrialba sp. INN-245]|uniref:saccharopine dehydrogenase family protein n=1 Tax=Natrialba sp. INN-245 TaxID=2690967 RepID=UPI001310499E|nr:saccharopine dehydrogenase NADP-binding domain-containing protein [Natrialba sp. INN-245]MWV40863.1 saccharopine dehydrogenase [Natrialba sp. INN-245]
MVSLLIYGSYGYTGTLVTREAVSRGLSPVVAGRDGTTVTRQANELGLEGRAIDLESSDLVSHLEAFDAVLNCAGPFVDTADPLVSACLEAETDYLDVTGEFPVLERLRQRDRDAREAGITLLPGVGFDVVPTDCLAAFLHDQLPSADRLTLGVRADASPSRGTAMTVLELAGNRGVVRRNGRLLQVPPAYRTREIDFGDGPEHAATIPLGDVVTAPWHTGIESVEVYAAMPSVASTAMRAADPFRGLLEIGPVRAALRWVIDAFVTGPGERQLREETVTVWGEVVDESADDGSTRRVQARLDTPNVYALTADAAVSAAECLLGGTDRANRDATPAGFQTPASAFGSEFVLDLEGTDRELLEVSSQAESNRTPLESED